MTDKSSCVVRVWRERSSRPLVALQRQLRAREEASGSGERHPRPGRVSTRWIRLNACKTHRPSITAAPLALARRVSEEGWTPMLGRTWCTHSLGNSLPLHRGRIEGCSSPSQQNGTATEVEPQKRRLCSRGLSHGPVACWGSLEPVQGAQFFHPQLRENVFAAKGLGSGPLPDSSSFSWGC